METSRPAFSALMSGRMIWAGGTRRSRMPMSVTMLTRTPAATDEYNSPTGTRLSTTTRKATRTSSTMESSITMPSTSFDLPHHDPPSFDRSHFDGRSRRDVSSLGQSVDPLAFDLHDARRAERRQRHALLAHSRPRALIHRAVFPRQAGLEHHPAPQPPPAAVAPDHHGPGQRQGQGNAHGAQRFFHSSKGDDETGQGGADPGETRHPEARNHKDLQREEHEAREEKQRGLPAHQACDHPGTVKQKQGDDAHGARNAQPRRRGLRDEPQEP